MTLSDSKTIYALASPPGRGGVGVVRVSGRIALLAAERLTLKTTHQFKPRHASLQKLAHPVSRETIDHALVLYFKGPNSYTGEDVVEFHIHGGPAVSRALIEALSELDGFRMAEPGEFTRRAFENGKMDLTEAEAVADLIHAETSLQRVQALKQLEGGLGDLYGTWAADLRKMLAHLEADLEFPDEDMPEGILPQIMPEIERLSAELDLHLNDNRAGERLRDGIHVAVIGAPNAGKSSLVNKLAKRDVAIVSDMAGTTRDVIEVHLDIAGYPVILSDTAGLRPEQLSDERAHDIIESEGIKRALEKAEAADIRVLVYDGESLPDFCPHTKALENESSISIFNKVDKIADLAALPKEGIWMSVSKDTGFDAFYSALENRLSAIFGSHEVLSLTRARHRHALSDCREALNRAIAAPMPELVAEDLRLAVRHLGRITGTVHVEDLLDDIFRDFCIGK